MLIHLIAAARPNFMKIAPLYHELKNDKDIEVKIIHTGQHYDRNMFSDIFKDLKLPSPDVSLGIGGGTHAYQVGTLMIEYEKLCLKQRPDLVIVVGDVNATMACAVTAKKLHIEVAHLEAGLRSFDMKMPEEINRIVTDSISDYFWTPSVDGNENLVRSGIDPKKIEFVGNIMIDSLEMMRDAIEKEKITENLSLKKGDFVLVTFHRPSNVDDKDKLESIVRELVNLSEKIKIVFPIHPRTEQNLKKFKLFSLLEEAENIVIKEPLSYKQFMKLVFDCKFVLTDSGGIQEETTYLKIPCLTFRDNTERPVTVTKGTNTLVNLSNLRENIQKIMKGEYKSGEIPLLWDGKTALRVHKEIRKILKTKAF